MEGIAGNCRRADRLERSAGRLDVPRRRLDIEPEMVVHPSVNNSMLDTSRRLRFDKKSSIWITPITSFTNEQIAAVS